MGVDYRIAPGLPEAARVGKLPDGARVLRTVARHTGVAVADILGIDRYKDMVLARHITMYVLVELEYPLKAAGRVVRRDHSTVLYAHRKVQSFIKVARGQYTQIAEVCAAILNELNTY